MNKFLFFPLITILFIPTIVKADSFWLVLYSPGSVEKIEMKDLSQCKKQGKKWKESIRLPGVSSESMLWACFEGK